MSKCNWFCVACILALSLPLAADEGISPQKLADLKAATVYVKVDAKDFGATGSGFLIRVDGDAGLVATNHHVVAAALRKDQPAKISLVFRSGTKNEQVVSAEILAFDALQDLAVLKTTSKMLPIPLDVAKPAALRETMTVYAFGFPLGDALSSNGSNPALTVGKGTVSSLREDRLGRLRRVQLDSELNPGNSGGPIVDAEGRLVGIAVSRVSGTKISFAIPSAELTQMLAGRAGSLVVRSLRVDNGVAEMEFEVPLIDPFQKLKTVELRHLRQDGNDLSKVDKNGNWLELPGAGVVGTRIEEGKAVARVTLKAPERKSYDWIFQTAYTNSEGKTLVTQPLARGINFAATGGIRATDPKAGPWETISSKEGEFTIDMPVKPLFSTSRTRQSGGSILKIVVMGCDT